MGKTAAQPVYAARRRRAWWERTLSRFLIAILAVLVLHLPMLLVKDTPEENAGDEAQLPEIGILPQDGEAAGERRPVPGTAFRNGELSEWLRIMNPSQWYYPDDIEGFSAWSMVPREHQAPELPLWVRQAMPAPETVIALQALTPEGENPEKYLRRDLHENTPEYRGLAEKKRNGEPVWRLGGGIQLKTPPVLDSGVHAELEKSRGAITGITLVEIQPYPGLSAPRVVLRESCGVPALDRAALRALRRFLHERQAGNLGASVFIETDWLN